MEIICLVLSLIGLFTDEAVVHIPLLLLHCALAAWVAWVLKTSQPLTALLLVCYAPMYFLNPMAVHMGWIELDSPPEALMLSNVLMMAGMDLFIFGARRLRTTKADLSKLPKVEITNSRLSLAIIVALSIYGIATCVQLLGVKNIDAARSAFDFSKEDMASEGDHNIFFLTSRYASLCLPFAGFFVALKPMRKQVPFLIPLMALLFINFLLYRVRQAPVAVFQGYVLGLLAKRVFVTIVGIPLAGKLSKQAVVILLVAIPTLGLTAISIRWIRAMYTSGVYDFSAESVQSITERTFEAGDLSVAYMVRKAVEKFPSEQPYFNGRSFYRLLFVPIPRSIWPDKPQPTQREFSAIIFPETAGTGLTVPAGLVGDLYVNFGPFGVLGMILLGYVFGQERYRTLTSLLMLAASGMWIFHFARGSQTGPVVLLFVSWPVAAAFKALLAPKPNASAEQGFYYAWWAPPGAQLTLPGTGFNLQKRPQSGA